MTSIAAPTTAEISANIVAQIEASLGQSVPLLPKAFIRVLAKALGAVFILLYKYGGFIALQQFVATASDQPTEINGKTVVPLTEWGRLIGVGDPTPATQAELVVDITVTNQVGILAAGTQLVGETNGVTYITIGAVDLNAPTVQATIRASSDQAGGAGRGEIGNLDAGAIVNFANPLANVLRATTVDSQAVTGADAETTANYRRRIIDAFSARPQGGAYADYRIWGAAVEGVAQVYPYTGEPGEVDVFVESSTEPDGIPTQAQLDAVSDAIELDDAGLATRRPAGALVNTLAISRTGWVVTVSSLFVPGSLGDAQIRITQAVESYFLDREPFIVGLDFPPRKDLITQSGVTGAVEDVVTALNGSFGEVSIAKTSNPGTPIQQDALAEGEKAKADSVSFV